MTGASSIWPVCGKCCEVAPFPWFGGPHECVASGTEEPFEELFDEPIRMEYADRPDPDDIIREFNRRLDAHLLLLVERARTAGATQLDIRLRRDGALDVLADGAPFGPDPTLRVRADQHDTVRGRLQQLAFLNPALTITLHGGPTARQRLVFHYPGGLADQVKFINRTRSGIFGVIHFCGVGEGCRFEVALQWNCGYSSTYRTLVNSTETEDDGTHLDGLQRALLSVLNTHARRKGMITDADLTSRDIDAGLSAVIALRMRSPRFGGQALLNAETEPLIASACIRYLTGWFDRNPREADFIVTKTIEEYQNRRREHRTECREIRN